MSKKLGLKIKQLRSEYGFKTGNKSKRSCR